MFSVGLIVGLVIGAIACATTFVCTDNAWEKELITKGHAERVLVNPTDTCSEFRLKTNCFLLHH